MTTDLDPYLIASNFHCLIVSLMSPSEPALTDFPTLTTIGYSALPYKHSIVHRRLLLVYFTLGQLLILLLWNTID